MLQVFDRIFLNQVECPTIIGVYDWEQKAPQNILVDVILFLNTQPATEHDDLTKTVDYDQVYRTIIICSQIRSYQLIETLAETIAQTLLAEYPQVFRSDITVYKPGAIPQAKTIGITITRFQKALL